MILLRLYLECARTGLFAVGGGLATIPFLEDMGSRTGWFTYADLTTMIAVSESTPGPIGINMATYVGYTTHGILGAILATLGLMTPSIVIILIIARMLQKFRQSKVVDAVFYGLRPASTALITAVGVSLALEVLRRTTAAAGVVIHWPSVVLALAVFICIKFTPLKKLHPIVFIGISAVVGAVFRF